LNEDKRLYFIRNIEALKDVDVQTQVTEYEIIADSDIVGSLTYDPYKCSIWEFSSKYEGEERKLCLRVREKVYPAVYQPKKPEEYSGFYHGGSIAEEFVYLASLFLRRRLELGPIVRWNDVPHFISKRKEWLDKQLILGKSSLHNLTDWFQLTEGLNRIYHQRFILATKFYHRALSLIDDQPDMAYIDLVSAIETLSRDFDIGNVTIADLNNQKLEKYVSAIDDAGLRSNIEKVIVKAYSFSKRRFKDFILDYTEETFWADQKRPVHGKIKCEELASLLGRIYDQRSKTLHNGEPFPAYIFSIPINGEEISSSLGISKGEKRWDTKYFIPYPHFFERLVNHVLKTFLRRNQIVRDNSFAQAYL